jgi:hypothetical protein
MDVQSKIQKLSTLLDKSELLSLQFEPTYLVHMLLKAHVTKVVVVVIIGCSSVKYLFIDVMSQKHKYSKHTQKQIKQNQHK